MCKIEKFRFTDQIWIEFEIFEFDNSEIEIGFCNFELCKFGNENFQIEISDFELTIQNSYFNFKFVFHTYIYNIYIYNITFIL